MRCYLIDQSRGGPAEASLTPLEQIEARYRELLKTLIDELLERVRSRKPKMFKQLVVNVLVAMGLYEKTRGEAERVAGAG